MKLKSRCQPQVNTAWLHKIYASPLMWECSAFPSHHFSTVYLLSKYWNAQYDAVSWLLRENNGRKCCLHENFELWSTSQSDKREMKKQYWRCLRVTSEIWMEKQVWISLMGHRSLMINWFWVTLTQSKKFNMRGKKRLLKPLFHWVIKSTIIWKVVVMKR